MPGYIIATQCSARGEPGWMMCAPRDQWDPMAEVGCIPRPGSPCLADGSGGRFCCPSDSLRMFPTYATQLARVEGAPATAEPAVVEQPLGPITVPGKPSGGMQYAYGDADGILGSVRAGVMDAVHTASGAVYGQVLEPSAPAPSTETPVVPEVQQASIMPSGALPWIAGGLVVLAVGAGLWALWPTRGE